MVEEVLVHWPFRVIFNNLQQLVTCSISPYVGWQYVGENWKPWQLCNSYSARNQPHRAVRIVLFIGSTGKCFR